MNIFCRLFGHTWWPEIDVPDIRWNTNKDGHVLTATSGEDSVRHFESCKRCGEHRDVRARSHDADRPAAQPEATKGSPGGS